MRKISESPIIQGGNEQFSVPHCSKSLIILQILSSFMWKFPSHAEFSQSFKCQYLCTCVQCLVPVTNMRLTFLLLLLYHLGKKFPWFRRYRGISLCDLGTQFLLCHQDNVFLWKRRCKKSVWYSSMFLYAELDQIFFGHCSEIGNDIHCTAKEIKELNIQIIKIRRRAFASHYYLSFVGRNWAVKWWNILEEKCKDKAKWVENT